MLQNRVQAFTLAGAVSWNGIPTTCHMATLAWCFHDEFTRPVASQNEYLDAFGNPAAVVGRMLPFGQRLSRPTVGNLALTPGSVLVFVRNGQPGHSCIATTANQIGGYNQGGWFTTPGANHNYSVHGTGDIKWRGAAYPTDLEANVQGVWCALFAIPQNAAKAVVRAAVQP